jgi:hypothetical protein
MDPMCPATCGSLVLPEEEPEVPKMPVEEEPKYSYVGCYKEDEEHDLFYGP